MKWEVRHQLSVPQPALSNDTTLGWGSLFVDTEVDAKAWFETKSRGRRLIRTVVTLFNPDGEVKGVACL